MSTIAGMLTERAAAAPDQTFVSFPDRDVSYGELAARSRALAHGLVRRGLRPGDHVAILMPNCIEFVELFFATVLAGGVVVPINARFKRHDLGYVIGHSDARFLVTTDAIDEHVNFTALLADLAPSPALQATFLAGTKRVPGTEPLETLAVQGEFTRVPSPDDLAVLLYTSGTTAAPKGCEIPGPAVLGAWTAYADLIGLQPGQTIWTPCPFFHVGGIGVLMSALAKAATMATMTHFDGATALDHLERLRAEHLFPAFPPLTLGLLHDPAYRPERLAAVRTVLNVSPPQTQRQIQNLLPHNAILLNDFGMTEGSGMMAVTPLDADEESRLGSNGPTLPGSELRITDPDSGEPVGAGVDGEIQFRGISAFRAYYKAPQDTAATILNGGWVRTGDRGHLDDAGRLHFTGRLKDMLKVGGENVAPQEVEAFLSTHPAVRMAQVVGRPSDYYGEVPVAFVERCGEVTEQQLIDHCTGNLASYKIPRAVIFVTEWPMSATKIQKFKLRATAASTPCPR